MNLGTYQYLLASFFLHLSLFAGFSIVFTGDISSHLKPVKAATRSYSVELISKAMAAKPVKREKPPLRKTTPTVKAPRSKINQKPHRKIGSPYPVLDFRKDVNFENLEALRELVSRVRRNKTYPYLAKRKGLSGRVTLFFHISPKGLIQNIKVTESSKHPVLDSAASKLFSSLGRLPALPASKSKSGLSVIFPLNYKL